jgi:hypothetical protein
MMFMVNHAVGATNAAWARGTAACVECLQQPSCGRAVGLAVPLGMPTPIFARDEAVVGLFGYCSLPPKVTRRRAGWLHWGAGDMRVPEQLSQPEAVLRHAKLV